MKKALIGIVVVLGVALYFSVQRSIELEEKWKVSEANVKAYSNRLGDSKKREVALMLTVDQLNYFKDSVLSELNETRKELKVKEKNLKALQAVQTVFSKSDTVVFRDTLFKEPALALDTLIQDKWYALNLGLKYPSVVTVKPQFKSEKHIVVSSKKETVNPPKKFFLFRWFQKRHTVLNVDVIEKNPYIEEQRSTYVEIIK